MGAVSGTYTTRRDGGVRYTYDAMWTEQRKSASWHAVVKRDGALVGKPGGKVLLSAGIDLRSAVVRQLEAALEVSAGLD
jgi:hypothetical protein